MSGMTTVMFNVNITDDQMFNCNETFKVTIADLPACITCGNFSSTTVIVMDDENSKCVIR